MLPALEIDRIGSFYCPDPEVAFSFCQQDSETPTGVHCEYQSNLPNFIPGYINGTESRNKVKVDNTSVLTEVVMHTGIEHVVTLYEKAGC